MFTFNKYKYGVTACSLQSREFLVKKMQEKYNTPDLEVQIRSYTANPENILANFTRNWNSRALSGNPNLTWEIVQKLPDDMWNWRELSGNPGITVDDIAFNRHKPWNWYAVQILTPFGVKIAKSRANALDFK